jgi:hypothetical protein
MSVIALSIAATVRKQDYEFGSMPFFLITGAAADDVRR